MRVSRKSCRSLCLVVEELEGRVVPALTPIGYYPAQLQAAYGFPTDLTGAGQTIAIIGAYHNPTIANDLSVFSKQFNLPAADLQVVSYTGRYQAGWATEAALDVQWAHALAPGAKLVLVEAASNGLADMMQAVSDSVTQYGATVVSMSWGSSEFPEQAFYDQTVFAPLASHGVTFVASSGDSGTVSWPAASPYVLSVGGTSLRAGSETAWSNGYGSGGGGVSQYAGQPGYQKDQLPGVSGRSTPDVAYSADPVSGVPVYVASQWHQVGGTSAGAPQWAGLIALANESRGAKNLPSLSGYTDVLPGLYTMARTNSSEYFTDITSGGKAGPGYDQSTGLGSPRAGKIIAFLSGSAATAGAPSSASTGTGATSKRATPLAIVNEAPVPPSINDVATLLTLGNRAFGGAATTSLPMQVQPIVLFRPDPILPPTQTISLPTLTRGLQFSPVYLGGGGGGGGGREAAKPEQPGQPSRPRIYAPLSPPPIQPPVQQNPQEQEREEQDSPRRDVSGTGFLDLRELELLGDVRTGDTAWSDHVSLGLVAGLVMGLEWNVLAPAAEDPRRKLDIRRSLR